MTFSVNSPDATRPGHDRQASFNLESFLIHGLDEFQHHRGSAVRHLTKSQQAYAALRRAIVTHALPAGTPLDELSLLERFPYGRTPLREALKQLSFEGMLVWPARQAPSIRDIGLHEMRYLYETRELLEPKVAELAATRLTNADQHAIDSVSEQLVEASRNGLVYESVELDYALHACIAQATRNRFLAEANDKLNFQALRLWYRAQRALGVESIHLSHTALVSAIREGNAETARDLATRHIGTSWERQRILLEGSKRPTTAKNSTG